MSVRPPRMAEWLLRIVLHPSVRSHALGDLQEEFSQLVGARGVRTARLWYWAQLARAVVPSVTRRLVDADHLGNGAFELRQVGRTLLRRPAFALVSVLTLALGIGSATAIYSLVNSVLLRPLPYPDSDRLVTVWNTYPDWENHEILSAYWDHIELSWPEYENWRAAQTSFTAVGTYAANLAVLNGGDGARITPVVQVSASLFSLLGATPHLGRFFAREEVGRGAPRLSVISYEFWRDRFGSDDGVLGRTVTLNDNPFQVIGVLPPGFDVRILGAPAALERRKDIWIPIGSDGSTLGEGQHSYEALGVLREDTSLEGAFDETLALLSGPAPKRARGARLLYREDAEANMARGPLVLLAGAAALLLLIACANVAGLYVAETSRRSGELATRAALGAGAGRVRAHLAFEGGLLGLMGAVVGIGIAHMILRVLVSLAPAELVLRADTHLGVSAVVVALGLGIGAGLLFSSLPSLRIVRGDLAPALHGARHRAGPGGRRFQSGLVGAQFAISLVLLIMGGLVAQSLARLVSVDPGFEASELLTARLSPTRGSYPTGEDLARFYHGLAERLEASPGVLSASVTSAMPFSGQGGTSSFGIVGREQPADEESPEGHRRTVRPGFTELLGLPLVAGRRLDLSDRTTEAPVVVISASMADRYWPSGDALGSRIRRDRRDFEIVGIVGDVIHTDLTGQPLPTFYVPIDVAERRRQMTVAIRTAGPPLQAAGLLRSIVSEIDANVPIERITTATSLLADTTREERFRSLLLVVFAISATLMSGIGLFGATARNVSARSRELGIRVALGAMRDGLVREVSLREGKVILLGVALGFAVALYATSLIGPMLFEISALDIPTFVGSAVALLAVGIGSTLLAARRTILADPAQAIRSD